MTFYILFLFVYSELSLKIWIQKQHSLNRIYNLDFTHGLLMFCVCKHTEWRYQGFGRVGACRGGLCEEMPGAVLYWIYLVLAVSNTDSLQDTSELINEAVAASMKTYFRKGKNAVWEWRKKKKSEKTTVKTPRLERKEGEELFMCCSRDSPAACGEDNSGAGCPSAAHGEDPHWSRYPHCRPWRTQWWSKWIYPERTVTHGKHPMDRVYPEYFQSVEKPHAGAGEKSE